MLFRAGTRTPPLRMGGGKVLAWVTWNRTVESPGDRAAAERNGIRCLLRLPHGTRNTGAG